ncbi:MAG TPA: putative metal-dependent hydrolase [Gemmatimonadales bacterium]
MNQDLRYPIGPFTKPKSFSADDRTRAIEEITHAPALVREAVRGLTAEQLATSYRPGGWTVRQVVHHLPDSHMNAYVRFKLALTEDQPTIKPYEEARWADLRDANEARLEASLTLLDVLHERWVMLLRSLTPGEFARTLKHPEIGVIDLDYLVAMYAWHGRHHAAHITSLRQRLGWG